MVTLSHFQQIMVKNKKGKNPAKFTIKETNSVERLWEQMHDVLCPVSRDISGYQWGETEAAVSLVCN